MTAVFAMSARTMSKKLKENHCGLDTLTKVGTCPSCGKRVERVPTDIFFPFCGYSCKRVQEKADENREKERAIVQEARYQRAIEKERLRARWTGRGKTIPEAIEEIRSRVEECQKAYEKNARDAIKFPKGSNRRRNAARVSQTWYGKMLEAQRELNTIEELFKEIKRYDSVR